MYTRVVTFKAAYYRDYQRARAGNARIRARSTIYVIELQLSRGEGAVIAVVQMPAERFSGIEDPRAAGWKSVTLLL